MLPGHPVLRLGCEESVDEAEILNGAEFKDAMKIRVQVTDTRRL